VIPAGVPIQRPADARLLAVDESGHVTHHRRADFPRFVRRGDLLVANDAATLPASLSGVHVPTGSRIELRLAARRSLVPRDVTNFTAVAFGEGDFRTPTERRPLPPSFAPGDRLRLGPLRAQVQRVHDHPRLIDVLFHGSAAEIWEGLARYGRPIQYAYVPEPLRIWDTWTRFANAPVAFEAPSAGFMLDWRTIDTLRRQGATFATITHAAGISSTGDPHLDARLPWDEPYDIPASTAARLAAARRHGGRIIAVGTTVVRALEDAAGRDTPIRSGPAIATLRVGRDTPLRIVDAIVSGQHEHGTSHYELLRAFQSDEVLRHVVREADLHEYRMHEFGDSLLILKQTGASRVVDGTAAA
jgi:S-adenosylmethionine:tRNA ribosyltransferase-isomerase